MRSVWSPAAVAAALVVAMDAPPARAGYTATIATGTAIRTLATQYNGTVVAALIDPNTDLTAQSTFSRINPFGTTTDTLAKFPLAGLVPAGMVIQAATVTFTAYLDDPGAPTLVAATAGAGAAGGVTLADFAAPLGTAGIDAVAPGIGPGLGAPPAAFRYDVTGLVRSLLAGGAAALDVQLDIVGAVSTQTLFVAGDPAYRPAAELPTLVITFAAVPEPGSAGLVLTGLAAAGVGLGWQRRRGRTMGRG